MANDNELFEKMLTQITDLKQRLAEKERENEILRVNPNYGTLTRQAMELEARKLTGEYYDRLRDPYIPEDDSNWVYGAALSTKFTLFGDKKQKWRLFYDPKLSFRGTTSQIREGQLDYSFGGEILHERGIRLYRRHTSRHVLERPRFERQYPVEDATCIDLIWELK